MYFNKSTKFVILSTALALQARAASPVRAAARATPTTAPFFPTDDNLVFNTTVPQGTHAVLGWVDSPVAGVPPFENVFDGSSRNISLFYTPPGGVEKFLIGFFDGPSTGFCGVTPGAVTETFIDSSVLGTYTGRWVVEFGQSTDTDAPLDPKTGCGPLPFTMEGVEFFKTWEVVAA